MKRLTSKCLAIVAFTAFAGLSSAALAQTPAHAPATGTTPTANSGAMAKGTPGTQMGDQFKDETSAKAHCPTDTLVWANTSSKAYHLSGTKYYGKTKKGAYMCQKDADKDGFHGAGKKKAATTKG